MNSIEQRILYEDNHLLIVNKIPSEIVQGDKTGDFCLLDKCKAYIKEKYSKPGEVFLGLAHRLDRPASGIVIFARTSKALRRMNEIFRQREIEKTYWAVVKTEPKPAKKKLTHFTLKNEKQNKSYVVADNRKGALKAELEYQHIASSDKYHLLQVRLFTGRHHQIRVQLSSIGSPIKGDVKYGFNRPNRNASIHLHAYRVEFLHPVKKEKLSIHALPPDDKLWNYFSSHFFPELSNPV